jgi:hypothetical protein
MEGHPGRMDIAVKTKSQGELLIDIAKGADRLRQAGRDRPARGRLGRQAGRGCLSGKLTGQSVKLCSAKKFLQSWRRSQLRLQVRTHLTQRPDAEAQVAVPLASIGHAGRVVNAPAFA